MTTTLTQELAQMESGHRACLVTRDKKLAKAVTRTLVPRNIQVDQLAKFPESTEDLAEYGFVLIDGDLGDPSVIESGLPEAVQGQNRVIIFSQNGEKSHLAKLIGRGNLTNFIAKNGGIREDELLITMHKLLTGEFFGMTQYLSHGTIPVERRLSVPSQRSEALSNLVSFLEDCMVSRRFIELARTAADELLMNALGRAPVQAQSAEPEDGTPHPVDFQYACDGRHVAVSVSDGYGTLTEDRLFGFLRRCFDMDEYQVPNDTIGGGLGLYVAFRSADQFVINIAQGVRTEVIGLIDIRGHLRDFEERSKSFHLFVTESESCPTT